MTKYYATCDANGLISHELEAETLSDARAELADATDSRDWIDGGAVDIEDELDVCYDGLTYSDACDRLRSAGATREVHSPTTDGWEIWSVDAD